jgi:hydroxymethylglutaryl-CoA lyase
MSIKQSLEAFRPVLDRASQLGWWKRAYVSTAFGCPFTGAVAVGKVVAVSARLLDLGADEICLGDTIGVGVPNQVHELTAAHLDQGIALDQLAYHFHDTRGTALANVLAGLEDGISCFDSSTGGTGGCPYAPGAAGNLATEDLVYLLDKMGIDHGVDLIKTLDAARFIANALGKPLSSKVGQAGGWDPKTGARTGI